MKEFVRNETDLAILSQLETDHYKQVKEVHEAEEVKKRCGRKRTRQILKEKSKRKNSPVNRRGENPLAFQLTKEGEKLLVREQSSPTKERYGEENLSYGTMVDEFAELLERYQQKQENYIQEMENAGKEVEITEINEELTAKAYRRGTLALPISYKIIEFFNFELAEEMEKNFDVTLQAIREALEGHPFTDESLGNLHIKVVDIPEQETERITKLRARHIGKMIKLKGQLDIVTQPKPEVVSAVFECNQCGELVEKEQDSAELKSPYKCPDCGSRKFDVEEKVMQDSRIIRVKTKASTNGNEKIRGRLEGLAVDEFDNLYSKIGKNIEVSGHLKEIPREKNSKKYDFYIEVNNIEFVDDNWNLEPLTEDRIQEIEDLRNKYEWKEWTRNLLESFAPHIKHRTSLKTAVLLWLLGRNDVDNGKEKTPDNLNGFIIGEPGVGKTQIVKWAVNHIPKTDRGSGEGATGVGITAAVTKDEYTGEMRAEAKLLPKMHNGFAAIDEFDSLKDQDYGNLLSIMSDQEFKLDKADIDETIPADVGILAAANPKFDNFDPYEPKTDQIPIPQDAVLNRFHFFLFAESGFRDEEKNREVNEAVLKQGEPEERLEKEGEYDKATLEAEEVVDIIRHAQSFEPFSSKEVRNKINKFFQQHKANFEDTNVVLNKRQLKGMKKIARAFARLDFSEEVKEKHLDMMKGFYEEIGARAVEDCKKENGLEDILGKRAKSKKIGQKQKRYKLQKVIKELNGDEEPVKVEDIVELMNDNLEESYIERVLESMKDKGEVFETEPGKIQLT